MAERQRRSGVRIAILAPAHVSHSSDQPLPNELYLHSGETKFLNAQPRPRVEQSTIAPPKKAEVSVTASPNHVSVTGWDWYPENLLKRAFWEHAELFPVGHDDHFNPVNEVVWELFFGEDPNSPTVERFGRNQQLLEVEYLGHPDELLIDLMHQQAEEYHPELVAHFPDPDGQTKKDTWYRSIIKTGPVLHSTVQHEGYYRHKRERYDYQYPARVMHFLELKWRDSTKEDKHEVVRRKVASALRLGVSVIADSDSKLRVYHGRWEGIEDMRPKSVRKAERAAGTPQIDKKAAVVAQMVAGLFQQATATYETGQTQLRNIIYDAPNYEITEEFQTVFAPTLESLRKLLNTRKKVTKKPKQSSET